MKLNQRFDFILVLCIVISIACGIISLVSQEHLLDEPPNRWLYQLLAGVVGFIIFFTLSYLNYQQLVQYAAPIYLFSILLLAITLIPGIGSQINGARSWLRLGFLSYQPSELAKISLILILATYLSLKEKEMHLLSTLIIPFALTLLPTILILVQPALGAAITLFPILLALLMLAGADMYYILSVTFLSIFSFVIPIYVEYHNITLIPILSRYLEEINKPDLIPVINILKTNTWYFINHATVPSKIELGQQDSNYLMGIVKNEVLMNSLKEAASTVRHEIGGMLLIFLEKAKLLVLMGAGLLFTALCFFAFRMARGVTFSGLRKFYIPVGILGLSLITAGGSQSLLSYKSHQVARITAFVSPDKFPRDLAYQTRASKAAIGSGEIIGRGLMKGEMTMGYHPLVPYAYTDFIFTSWSERTGFIGSIFLILVLMGIIIRSLIISYESRDRFGSLLAGGIAIMYFLNISLNLAIGVGLLPVTGLPLSFVSYGGSHLVTCMAAAGILMSVYSKKFVN